MSAGSSPDEIAPKPADVPFPSFARQADEFRAPSELGSSAQPPEEIQGTREVLGLGLAESLERCAAIVRSCCSQEVQALLEDLACILLAQETRTLKLARLGEQLAESSQAFLRSRKVGLKAVLMCYRSDFRIAGHGRQQTVAYLHGTVN
eukprot:TRINITY_DN17781_c0_g1_i1.p1 TRINITY_DN17781_c0_g1~~TRINITY_DN17781_c0_g1_i1.p1  ORF type:complete len:149 (-),score=22.08 TRINITY_DN17781_c0_g1_i1:183-629(-)